MTTVRRIVVALDDSASSVRALPLAIRLAERAGIPIDVIGTPDRPDDVARLREELVTIIHEAGSAVRSSFVIESADVPVEFARQIRAVPGSIVLTSSQAARAPWTLSESVTTELLSEGVPVMIIGPEAVACAEDLPVVACLDESVESQSLIPVAAEWASLLRVPLVLLTVDRPHLRHLPLKSPLIADAVDGDRVMQLAADARLEWPELDVRCHVARYPWSVVDALVLYLGRHPSQVFVVASHVRTGLSRVLHPTTAGQIARSLAAPVLVVPIPLDAADGPEHVSRTRSAPAFAEVIVPVGPHRPVVDACIATANNLAVLAGASITLLTCDQDPDRVRRNDAARSEVLSLLSPTVARWRVEEASDVVGTIVDEATTHDTSIVCLATHAPGRVVDTLLPTVTGRLVRWSPCTVVLVGPHCEPATKPYTEVVACIDGSSISESVCDLAGSWAAAFGVSAGVLTSTDPATAIAGAPPIASRYVHRLAARVGRAHDVATTVTLLSDAHPAKAIVRWARAHPTTLLVMASHGEGASNGLLGGTVMHVVRHTSTPVVVVPAHGSDERVS